MFGDEEPVYNNETGNFEIRAPLGSDGVRLDDSPMNITNTAKFILPITVAGGSRPRARSEVFRSEDFQIDNHYNLNGQLITTTPYGISIGFSCVYNTKISVSTGMYSVEDVSISDSLTSSGDWSPAFALTLIGQ